MRYSIISVVLISGIYGVMLESNTDIQAHQLFIGLHLAGLGGISMAALSVNKKISLGKRIWVFLVLQLIAFRVAYFPVMVLSATVACYSEWLLITAIPELPIKIFPMFFISASLLFAIFSELLFFSLNGEKAAALVIVCIMIPMTMISFSTREDFTVLPDHNWINNMSLPEIRLPEQNPYLTVSQTQEINIAQQVVALAGALLYPLIPNSPWAITSKGILEHAYRDNPAGSSLDRLNDHYAAFIAAHRFVTNASKKSKNAGSSKTL